MKAEAKALGFLTMEGKIKIPFFQRSYVWDKDNWSDLFEEFINPNKTNNFLGAIILKQLPRLSGQANELEVIDGQQRLTTISILLKALYDSFPDDIKQNIKDSIFKILFYKKDYTSPEYDEVRIEHSYTDSEKYKLVIRESETLDLDTITQNSHRILRCYQHFKFRFDEMNLQKKRDFLNRILDPNNKMLVVIDLEEKDDEQAIFDTLNTAGVRLSSAEIIKNALYKKLIELSNQQEAINFYEKTWENIFYKDEETKNYWEKELATGRFKRQNIEILLHSFAIIDSFYDPDQHTLTDLSQLYKNKINNFTSSSGIKDFIKKIMKYANLYKENFQNFDNKDYLFYGDDLNSIKLRLFHILNTLDISTLHPLILFIMANKSEEEQIKYFLALEKLVIRNAVTQKIPIKNYNKLIKQLIKNLSKIDEVLSIIDNDDIEVSLKRISNKLASLILFWIELYRRFQDKKHDNLELKYTYSLEHIMPIKWKEHWNFDIVPHPNQQLSEIEQEQDRNEKIYWIGNMTLLSGRLNSALRNYSFQKKIEGEGRKKGIKDYAELTITKEIVKEYDNDQTWNETKIEDRTNQLTTEFLTLWPK